ncbi:MAG TPA: tetratricopeptide repeat protein [Gallionella sp.]|nr:tetratricopeptide repeat protein [Gallionella sp.]
MSLLLDARKKALQAQAALAGSGRELSLEPHPDARSAVTSSSVSSADVPSSDDRARIAGQNLFKAKSSDPSLAGHSINRNLLIALGGTILILAAGAGYVWYAISPGKPVQQPRPIDRPVASLENPAPANNLVPDVVSARTASMMPAAIDKPARATKRPARAPRSRQSDQVLVEQHQDEPIDPILNDAYLAYRSGKFDQAQQLYLKALNLDSNNTDALLGLAVIAQRRGADNVAAHYYAQVLALDPRNAVANAGMSALSNDDNRESRLKTLLNEQQNSSALHFALGNYYAEQARWGEAQQAYFNAYKLEPGNAELAFNLAVSLDRLGQNKPAGQYYQRALQLDPDHHAAFDHAHISQRIEELTY